MQRIHDVIAAIAPHDSVERYTCLGVEVLQGYAKIINPWTVEIALQRRRQTNADHAQHRHCRWCARPLCHPCRGSG